MSEVHIEGGQLFIQPGDQFSDDCDGCNRKIEVGEAHLSGIGSCCGSGCYRHLCRDCVLKAAETLKGML